MTYLIGLDIGTTGCRAAIFDEKGNIQAQARREYGVDMPYPQWAEQDAEKVWLFAQETLAETVAQCPNKKEIVALGLSVQGEAIIPVDVEGKALRAAILGMDTRTEEQNLWLKQHFGARALFEHSGMPIHTINTLPKLLWLKQNEPIMWGQANRFLLYEDFIIQKMTGKAVCSECLASRTQLFSLKQKQWSSMVLESIGLDEEKLALVVPSGTAVAAMKPELAHALGFARAPLVVSGGHDQACGALGAGLVRGGEASVSSGTAEVVEVAMENLTLNDALFEANVSIYSHVVAGLYLAMTLNHSGGILLRWFRDNFCQWEMDKAKGLHIDAYDLILEGASRSPSGLLVLPHFSGSGTPWFDTSSKGAVLGLNLTVTKNDFAKAILEGLTYELRVNLDTLRENGIPVQELRAIGGGARSLLWLHMKADITGIPVLQPRITDAACWGAAILAGVGAGVFNNAVQAAEQSLMIENRVEPEEQFCIEYERQYRLYQKVYPAVKPIQDLL